MNKTFSDLIVGLGQTGLSCARYFTRHNIPFSVTDSRNNPPGAEVLACLTPQAKVAFGGLSQHLINQAQRLIVSPGISLKEPVIARAAQEGKTVIGDIELFAQAVKEVPIVAITGSNGKSTVTTLVGEMARQAGLKVQVAGNIGTPVLDCLEQETDLFVLELSSFQLETTFSLTSVGASILNISPDHMDRYVDVSDYVAAKQRIYQHAKTAVYNRGDELTQPQSAVGKHLSFDLTEPENASQYGLLQQRGKTYLAKGQQPLVATDELLLKGRNHWLNALAGLALGEVVGLPFEVMVSVVKTFKGLPHRCELIAKHHDIAWYNDSKATNIGATISALQSLGRDGYPNLILLAGGQGKGADFTLLKPWIERYVKQLIVYGEDRALIWSACANQVSTIEVDNLECAVKQAKQLAKPSDSVLLAPACASFDEFKDFNERGEKYTQWVKAIIAG